MNVIKVNHWKKIPKKYTGCIEIAGSLYWFKDGKHHREDGPAYITKTGYKEWYINGSKIWSSGRKDIYDYKSYIVISKMVHPKYLFVEKLKILDDNGILEIDKINEEIY